MCVQCSKDVKKCKSRELRGSILYTSCDCIKRNGLQDSCPRSECQGAPACMVMPEPTCCPAKHAQRYINMRSNIGRSKCPEDAAKSNCCPKGTNAGGNSQQVKSGTCEQVSNACEQVKSSTCEQVSNACEQGRNNSCAQAKSNTCEQGRSNSCEQGRSNSCEQGRSNSCEQGRRNTCEQVNNACEQARNNTCEQQKSSTCEQSKSSTGACPPSTGGSQTAKPGCQRLGGGSDGDGPQYNCRNKHIQKEDAENKCYCKCCF